jgi:hypothetical protein
MTLTIDAATLRTLSLDELEALYLEERPLEVPAGAFRGRHLAWVDSPGARHPLWRPLTALMFERTPFGVDFEARRWFFFRRGLAAGRFTPRVARSRWRETETVALDYGVSRLPGPLRALLYDEVKPLSPTLALGIGGIAAPRGEGDLFFFSLEPLAR